MRKLLNPLLKLLFNPNTLNQVLHTQAQFNVDAAQARSAPQDRVRSLARRVERALLRGAAQPRARNHAHGHRGAEPAHEGRVAVEPPRFQRAPRARARRRRAVPARGRCAATDATTSATTITRRRRRRRLAVARRIRAGRRRGRPAGSGRWQRGRKRRRRRRGRRGGQGDQGALGCLRCAGCAGCAGCSGRDQAARGRSDDNGFDDGGDDDDGDEFEQRRRARAQPVERDSSAVDASRARLTHPTHPTHPMHPMHPMHLRHPMHPNQATTTCSEGRDRRPAVRRRHQRRRRAACALRGRAPGETRPGRGADDVRASRLHFVEERAAARAARSSTASRCTASRCRSSAIPSSSRSGRTKVFTQQHSLRDELAWLDAEGPTSPALIEHIKAARSRLRLLHLLQLPVSPLVSRLPRGGRRRRSWCRPPSATARSGWDSIRRSSAACARSCTTRSKSAR